jgi:hypothetical protein
VAQIDKPSGFLGEAQSTSGLLVEITKWQAKHPLDAPDAHRRIWYRGHSDQSYLLRPGVYRDEFTEASKRIYGNGAEEKRLNLEREMMSDFRASGATQVNANSIVEVYSTAQHYGMPTSKSPVFTAVCLEVPFQKWIRSHRHQPRSGGQGTSGGRGFDTSVSQWLPVIRTCDFHRVKETTCNALILGVLCPEANRATQNRKGTAFTVPFSKRQGVIRKFRPLIFRVSTSTLVVNRSAVASKKFPATSLHAFVALDTCISALRCVRRQFSHPVVGFCA